MQQTNIRLNLWKKCVWISWKNKSMLQIVLVREMQAFYFVFNFAILKT